LEGGTAKAVNGASGKYDVHCDAQFRFKPARQALRPGLEAGLRCRHGACIGEQRAALVG